MWAETRRVCLTSLLRQILERDEREAADEEQPQAKRDAAERSAKYMREEIARREGDTRYTIEVKHVGSADDPLAYEALCAAEENARHKARRRARLSLLDGGEQVTPDSVNDEMTRDPTWRHDYGKILRDWIVAGVVNGTSEYHRLYELGCRDAGASAGSSMLIAAVFEVRRYQEVPAETGKD